MHNSTFKILGKEIEKGQRAFLQIEVAKLHTRNTIKIPVIVERAKLDGPTILLMGGVHGDEVNGVAIVRNIIRKNTISQKEAPLFVFPFSMYLVI